MPSPSENTSPVAIATPAITALAVATPANLESIPSVVAELPSPSLEENDVELQNGSSSVPVVVATAIRGEAEPQTAEPEIELSHKKSWKCTCRKENNKLVLLLLLVSLLIMAVVINEVLTLTRKAAKSKSEESSSTFTYFEYPPLMLTETVPCDSITSNSSSCKWVQIGSDLVGPTAGDFFGATLRLGSSASRSRFSVTAPLYRANHGLTQVYDIIETINTANNTTGYSFKQVGKNFTGNRRNDEMRGIISDDGYHLIMSSVNAARGGVPHIGQFESFQLSPQNQFEMYGNEMYGESSLDDFGVAVVNRDGTVVAISDVKYDFENSNVSLTNAGVVTMFQYNKESNQWDRLGQKLEGTSTNEYWGRKMALSGDGYTVAIGSHNSDDDKGKVEVYRYDPALDKWVILGEAITGQAIGQGVGRELELSSDGKVLAVTSNFVSSEQIKTGVVQIFEYSQNTNQWQQLGNDIISELSLSDFGYQLRSSDDGMRLSISEAKYSPSDELSSAGSVRVYDYIQDEKDWRLIDDVVGQRNCDFVGAGFDLSPDGSRLIVGFPNAEGLGNRGPDCAKDGIGEPVLGVVRLYELKQ